MQAVADMYVQTLNAVTVSWERLYCDAVQDGLTGRILTIVASQAKVTDSLEPVSKGRESNIQVRSYMAIYRRSMQSATHERRFVRPHSSATPCCTSLFSKSTHISIRGRSTYAASRA